MALSLSSIQRIASDSTSSLVDLAQRCELDERMLRGGSGILRPKSKPSDLDLHGLSSSDGVTEVTRPISQENETPRKKRRVAIAWEDLRKLKLVGEGAHCTVHFAELNGAPVAVKMLTLRATNDPVAVRDLECEADLMVNMRHPNVLRLLGTGSSDGCLFLVIDRLSSTLAEALAKPGTAIFPQRAYAKAWPLHKALRSAAEIARALAYIHEGAFEGHRLVHRDLKPDNIGVSPDGHMVLFDFGLAKLVPTEAAAAEEAARMMTGQTGSVRYMAPEVALNKPYGASADVYSFVCVLYQMVAHEKPYNWMDIETIYKNVFYGEQRPSLQKGWPAPLQELFEECWHHNPERRPQMKDVASKLAAMAENSSTT